MLNNERDLVTRLLKQNIVTLCKETVSYDTQLEIDGIICISAGNESQQIVVKVHHFFQKLGAKSQHARSPVENHILETKVTDSVWEERKQEKRYPILNGPGLTTVQHVGQVHKELEHCLQESQSKTGNSVSESKQIPLSSAFYKPCLNGGKHQNFNKKLDEKIPKTIISLDHEEESHFEHKKIESIDSFSESDTMDYDDTCGDDDTIGDGKENQRNAGVSLNENEDVISELSRESSMKMSPNNVTSGQIETKVSRKHASPDENSMIECKLGKNCTTDEDMSKIPIRQVRDIPCKRCGVILDDGAAFEHHNTDVHSVYTCRVCFNTFTCRNNMKRHMRLHTGFRPYTCKLCSESFTRKDDIKRHLIRHSFDKPFRCNICRKGYMDRKTVKNHVRKEHNSKIIHICQTCGETFDNSVKFNDHKKNHPELKMFQCSLCKFTGSNLLTYNKHQLVHEVKKDYRCDPCDIVFGDPFRYTTHLRKHRTDTNFVSYRCCFCNLNLSSYELFLRHEHTHDQSKQFTCFVCMKQFQSEATLKDHKRSHPTYNCHSHNESTSGHLIPTIIDAHMLARQPMFPTFTSSLSTAIQLDETARELKYEQLNSGLNENLESKISKCTSNERSPECIDDIESIIKYEEDKRKVKIENENFDSSGNTQNDYWCAECQHGFATEDHLTEHIALAHENSNSPVENTENAWETPQRNNNSSRIGNNENSRESIIRPTLEQYDMSDNDESFEEFEENNDSLDNPDRSSGSIRYTPVPIFNSKTNTKKGPPRQDSNGLNNDHEATSKSPKSPEIFYEATSEDNSNPASTCDNQDFSENQTDRCYGQLSGKKNYHAQNKYMCDICFMNFTSFEEFDIHSSNIHRKFVCHFCGKGFTSRPNRDRHVRYHTGEKPFKCEVCHQSFVRGDDLRYHRTSKHPDVKPYTCNFCGMSFPWAKDLERHAKTHGIG